MPPTPASRLRGVVIPPEHGGWGLTLEPIVLGLIIAPSTAGFALGAAALAAFLFRTPFKVTAGDLRRGRWMPRTGLAVRAAAVYGAVLLASVAVAVLTAEHSFWWPLAIAVPFMAVQAAYDVRSRSRRLIPEIAGPFGIGSVAAAIALAGGQEAVPALGLWLVMALRSMASIVLVRAQLRRAKEQPYREAPVHAVGLASATIAAVAAAFEVIPWLGAVAAALLAPFGWWSLWRPSVRAVIVGIHQTVLGIVIVTLTAAGALAGL